MSSLSGLCAQWYDDYDALVSSHGPINTIATLWHKIKVNNVTFASETYDEGKKTCNNTIKAKVEEDDGDVFI